MSLTPEFDFSPLHGLALLLPLLLARIGIPLLVNRGALHRLGFTPSPEGHERWALPLYVICEGVLLLYPFFLTIKEGGWLVLGLPFMVAGLIPVALSAREFSRTEPPHFSGIYRYSRNPMYVGYFLYYVGIGLVTASWLYLAVLFVYEIALYWLIRGEERWCLATFGEPYRRYAQQVRRYAGRRTAAG